MKVKSGGSVLVGVRFPNRTFPSEWTLSCKEGGGGDTGGQGGGVFGTGVNPWNDRRPEEETGPVGHRPDPGVLQSFRGVEVARWTEVRSWDRDLVETGQTRLDQRDGVREGTENRWTGK